MSFCSFVDRLEFLRWLYCRNPAHLRRHLGLKFNEQILEIVHSISATQDGKKWNGVCNVFYTLSFWVLIWRCFLSLGFAEPYNLLSFVWYTQRKRNLSFVFKGLTRSWVFPPNFNTPAFYRSSHFHKVLIRKPRMVEYSLNLKYLT